MAEDVRARAFDPLYTTKAGRLGLGLSLAYGSVLRHGGRLSVRSNPREGSSFQIVLAAFDGTGDADEALAVRADALLLVSDRMRRLRLLSAFEDAGVQVLAISCDSRHAQRIWAEQQGYQFPVLSDFWPHGEVSKAYGVFNEAIGAANRGTFVIGKDGKVVDTFASPDLGTARPAARYEEALAKL